MKGHIMNEEIKITPEYERPDSEAAKKDLRRAYSRCGWVLLAFAVLSMILSFFLDSIFELESDAVKAFVSKNALFVNALVIGGATLGAALLLKFIPKSAPVRQKTPPKDFFKFVLVAFGISCIGNLITRFTTGFIYFVSGIELTDRVSAAIASVDPPQVFVCVVLIAPITEEFLFRKLLIDRLHKHGELLAILTSAIFFGLYHQNIYQMLPTFAAGLVLGYLYCKTGSYLAVTLLHAIYNFVGVFSLVFNPKLIEFSQFSAEELAALPAEVYAEYRAAMVGYIIYMLIAAAINITGIVLLIINRNKFPVEKNAPALLESDKREIAIRAPGVIAAGVLMILLTIRSLFI